MKSAFSIIDEMFIKEMENAELYKKIWFRNIFLCGCGVATRGWKKDKPGYHQKTIMLRKCGRKCFLGPGKSFPICKKNTCAISSKGVYSAYIIVF